MTTVITFLLGMVSGALALFLILVYAALKRLGEDGLENKMQAWARQRKEKNNG